jgi:hypothetical protein
MGKSASVEVVLTGQNPVRRFPRSGVTSVPASAAEVDYLTGKGGFPGGPPHSGHERQGICQETGQKDMVTVFE